MLELSVKLFTNIVPFSYELWFAYNDLSNPYSLTLKINDQNITMLQNFSKVTFVVLTITDVYKKLC